MVVPERERPGITAKACPIPTANACQYDIPFLYSLGGKMDFMPGRDAKSEKKRRAAVARSANPTTVMEPKRDST